MSDSNSARTASNSSTAGAPVALSESTPVDVLAVLASHGDMREATGKPNLAAELREARAAVAEVLVAGRALVARWDTPRWKDVPHTAEFIHALRDAIAKAAGEQA